MRLGFIYKGLELRKKNHKKMLRKVCLKKVLVQVRYCLQKVVPTWYNIHGWFFSFLEVAWEGIVGWLGYGKLA